LAVTSVRDADSGKTAISTNVNANIVFFCSIWIKMNL